MPRDLNTFESPSNSMNLCTSSHCDILVPFGAQTLPNPVFFYQNKGVLGTPRTLF